MNLIYAIALLRVKSSYLLALHRDLQGMSAVGMIFPTTGRADLIVMLHADDPGILGAILTQELQVHPAITHLEVFIFIGTLKSMDWAQAAVENGVTGCILIEVGARGLINVGKRISAHPAVTFIAPTAGSVDIIAMVRADTLATFGAAISTIQGYDGVQHTETLIALGKITLHNWALALVSHTNEANG
jgi:DNA-binding Lrp family transcriptional regulator